MRVDPDVPAGGRRSRGRGQHHDHRSRSAPGFFTAYAGRTAASRSHRCSTPTAPTRPGRRRRSCRSAPKASTCTRSRGDHVIVDIAGYFTGASASSSTAGRFVADIPIRLVDTRQPAGAGGGPRLWDGGAREFAVTPITGGPVAAVAANVTMTQTEDPGYVTAGPAAGHRDTRRRASTPTPPSAPSPTRRSSRCRQPASSSRRSKRPTSWSTSPDGSPAIPSPRRRAAPANVPPPDRKVTIISDSAMAGVRWNGALDGLQGMIADDRMESCRRLVQASCRGREGYAPRNVVQRDQRRCRRSAPRTSW